MIREGLDSYIVRLVMSGCVLDFQCMADNFAHAEEQAINAYPDCRVCSIHKLPAAESE